MQQVLLYTLGRLAEKSRQVCNTVGMTEQNWNQILPVHGLMHPR